MKYQVMPDLTPSEYADLKEDIAANGVLVPVLVTPEGEIVDGHNRARIADSLKVPYPTQVVEGYTETELRDMAYRLNLHRRHLSREQRREIIAESLKADPQLSNRQHADRTGADHKTVGSQREALESRGEIPHADTRTDSAGRQQPSGKPGRGSGDVSTTESVTPQEVLDEESDSTDDLQPATDEVAADSGSAPQSDPGNPFAIAAQARKEFREQPFNVFVHKILHSVRINAKWIEERGVADLFEDFDAHRGPGDDITLELLESDSRRMIAIGTAIQDEVARRRKIGLKVVQ